MTEKEWLTETLSLELMQQARPLGRDGNRELDGEPGNCEWLLVAARVACLERFGPNLPEGVRKWVMSATAYLDLEDRCASSGDLLDLSKTPEVYASFREAYSAAGPEFRQCLAAAQDVFHGGDYYCFESLLLEVDGTSLTYTGPIYAAESTAHCDIIRDIFGNPFHPVVFDSAWRTDTVASLARGMYESRDFSAMPILADALQDAGCEHADILTHCRDPNGVHVRGCWVVDLVLGKA